MKIYRLSQDDFNSQLKEFIGRKVSEPWSLSESELKDMNYVFTEEFRNIINQGYAEMNHWPWIMRKPIYAGKVKGCIYPYIHPFLPEGVLEIDVWVATSINKRPLDSAATGTDAKTGKKIIVFNPSQAQAMYVKYFFHEIKHNIDILNGKETTQTEGLNPEDAMKIPSERRARYFEDSFFKSLHKSLRKERKKK